ncbi:STAS domain-containing protein [Desulfobacterota bacterium M19]
MTIETAVTQKENETEIMITGELDEQGAEQLKEAFTTLLGKAPAAVKINLIGIEIMGSSAIGKILLFYKNFTVGGGSLSVINLAPHLLELFKELKLDSLFPIAGR